MGIDNFTTSQGSLRTAPRSQCDGSRESRARMIGRGGAPHAVDKGAKFGRRIDWHHLSSRLIASAEIIAVWDVDWVVATNQCQTPVAAAVGGVVTRRGCHAVPCHSRSAEGNASRAVLCCAGKTDLGSLQEPRGCCASSTPSTRFSFRIMGFLIAKSIEIGHSSPQANAPSSRSCSALSESGPRSSSELGPASSKSMPCTMPSQVGPQAT